MSRFQRLALAAAVTTFLLVVVGAIVRSTGSGMGCPDWPTCHGSFIPPLSDTAAWIEWTHRTIAVIVGLLVLALVIVAWRRERATRSLVVASFAALVLTGFQAYLGKVTVDTSNAGQWVTAHLATAMILLGLLTFIVVRAYFPPKLPDRGASQRLSLAVMFAAASVYALLLFGAQVTATGAALVFPDWPLFNGQLVPVLSTDPAVAALQSAHFVHRFVAALVAVIVWVVAWAVWRAVKAGRASQSVLALVGTAAALYALQLIVGALQIWTTLAPWAVALHVGLGAAIWALLAGGAFLAYYQARTSEATASADKAPELTDTPTASLRDRVGAYVALTKPRIIELLLVTTVPAMVLAARGVPSLWLVFWTLVGGTLAAGAANAINCYFDRDIDEVMNRTRRRPLPAHAVPPENALVFGLVLGVISFALMTFFVNLVAAFLTLVAMAFYVIVYTLILKRSTPQNIVLGGAAGALPPVIGWAAVTGDITLPALLLFAVVFYWTPPHFWALSMRLRKDYAMAGVPMLPVVAGVAETNRQILLYTLLMVALTLAFFAVAHMGLVFLAGAILLGGLFLFQAVAMWRDGSDARAVRLYKYSITYLAALFGLIILDVFLYFPL
jgi:protoheme IX farnesyltransferase